MIGTIVARAASVLSDGIVLMLTLMKTYSKIRKSVGLDGYDTVLGTLLRDGQCVLDYQVDYAFITPHSICLLCVRVSFPQVLTTIEFTHARTQIPVHNEHYWNGHCTNDSGK